MNDNLNDFFDYANISKHKTINTSIEYDDEADLVMTKNNSSNIGNSITLNDISLIRILRTLMNWKVRIQKSLDF